MNPEQGIVAGETLVDLFPDGPGDLVDVDGFRHRAGGAPANVAAALARLASSPLFWTRLGGDPFGDYLAGVLSGEGVPDQFVVRADDPTALAVVTPTAAGHRSFSFYERGTATLGFESEAVPDDALAAHEWVHFGGVPLVRESARDALFDFASRARDRDCTVTFDPNFRADLWDDPSEAGGVLGDAFALTDVLLCSPSDLAPLGLAERARRNAEAAAADLLERGPHTVFLTCGADGATVATDATATGERTIHAEPAFDVDVVDTTGAGDAFAAAALARFEVGLPASDLPDVLRFANAAGALATTETGAITSLPSVDAVRALAATSTT